MKIVIDAFGGDNAPNAILDGVLIALKKFDFSVVLTGKKDVIEDYLKDKKFDRERVEIVDAPEVITNDDTPTEAIRTKKQSSLVVAFDILKKDDDCKALISAGSTGATLTGGFLKCGRIKGISRPALAPLLPTRTGGMVVLIDCGANVDCKPINLCHFALMGSEYYRTLFGVENPRVGLLSNGVEDKKGNELVHKTFPLLKQLPINFVGNMEARYALSGDYDVIVSDGFAGNVLLKTVEGSVKFTTGVMKDAMTSTFVSKIGALLCKRALKKVKNRLDYNKYGGSFFVGCKKTIIKSHGSSKAETICAAIEQAINLENKKVGEAIRQKIENMPELDFGEDNE
ncbi:MAG: phosphate acyltransferase PlsX [Clostridia bacterium]|nr:phosphate acyltransferase PlsX [Clostridia bacterium]